MNVNGVCYAACPEPRAIAETPEIFTLLCFNYAPFKIMLKWSLLCQKNNYVHSDLHTSGWMWSIAYSPQTPHC